MIFLSLPAKANFSEFGRCGNDLLNRPLKPSFAIIGKNPSPTSAKDEAKLEYISEG